MKYLVEVNPTLQRATEIEEKGTFGSMISYINERYKPECVYINPTQNQLFMIVDLANEVECCELTTWFSRGVMNAPKCTPLASPNILNKAMDNLKRTPWF